MPRKDKFLRKCIACSLFKTKNELLKITKESSTGDIVISPSSNIYGRSVYVCLDKACIDTAFKKMKIEKFLKANISKDIKEKINAVLEK